MTSKRLRDEIDCITPSFGERVPRAKGPRFVGEFDPPIPVFAFSQSPEVRALLKVNHTMTAAALQQALGCERVLLNEWLERQCRQGKLRRFTWDVKAGFTSATEHYSLVHKDGEG